MMRHPMTRWFFLLLGLNLLLLAGCGGKTEQGTGQTSGTSLPAIPADELALIPKDAVLVAYARLGEVWPSHGATFLKRVQESEPDLWDSMADELGFTYADVDRLLLVYPEMNGNTIPLFLGKKPVDKDKITKTILKPSASASNLDQMGRALHGTAVKPTVPEVETKQINGKTYFRLKQRYTDKSVFFLGDRGVAFGPTASIEAMLQDHGKLEDNPLALQLQREAAQHQMAAIVQLPPGLPTPPDMPPALTGLLQAKKALLTLDLDNRVQLTTRLTFPQAEQAQQHVSAVKNAVVLLQTLAPQVRKHLEQELVENPVPPQHLLRFFGQSLTALNALAVQAEATDLTVKLTVESDPHTIASALVDLVNSVGSRASSSFNTIGSAAANLRQITAALQSYREKHGHYPPAAIYAPDGTPLLSWRVALLPYLGQEELYKKFKLEEPWSSKTNYALLRQMPSVYGTYRTTRFRTFTGPGTAHEGKAGPKPADFPNGGSSTFFVVEAAYAVDWTRPENLLLASDKPFPRLSGNQAQGFHALLLDGTIRFFKAEQVSEATGRKLASKTDGPVDMSTLGEVIKE